MSWSNTFKGKSIEEVGILVSKSSWNSVPSAVVSAIESVVYSLPKIQEGFELEVVTSGHTWFPDRSIKGAENYYDQISVKIEINLKQLPVAVVANGITANT